MGRVSEKDNQHYRATLERMLAALDRADTDCFNRELEQLTQLREQNLFREIGKLTRELHDALNAFHVDSRIGAFLNSEMPDARVRLKRVIDTTEDAAHRSLALVENGRAEQEAFSERVERMPTKPSSAQIGEFVAFCEALAVRWRQNLAALLIAQDFQDLTGQIIREVIALVERVEEALVDLVRLSGEEAGALGRAPAADTLDGQDQVDDLLSSLGF